MLQAPSVAKTQENKAENWDALFPEQSDQARGIVYDNSGWHRT